MFDEFIEGYWAYRAKPKSFMSRKNILEMIIKIVRILIFLDHLDDDLDHDDDDGVDVINHHHQNVSNNSIIRLDYKIPYQKPSNFRLNYGIKWL